MSSLKHYASNKNITVFFIFLTAIYSLPIFFTGRLYIDDLGRTLYGYTGWGANGRPLSDLIMQTMSFGGLLLDLSPLNQLIGLSLLFLALFFYAERNLKGVSQAEKLTAVFLFIANPFYIENLSYKFDCLPMSLSIVMLLIPFTMNEDGFLKKVFSVLFVIASLSLYQASIGLFIILTLLDIVGKNNQAGNRLILLYTFKRILQLILAYVLYKFFIASSFVKDEYNIIHSEVIPFSLDSIEIIKKNATEIIWFLRSYVDTIPLFMKVIFSLAIIYSIYKSFIELWIIDRKRHCFAMFITLLSPVLVLAFAIAPLLLLKQPVFAPRVLLSLSGLMMFYSYITMKKINQLPIKIVLYAPLIWLCMVYSYSYSNASISQERMDTLISSSIYQDISHSGRDFNYVNVLGQMPKSQQLVIAESKLPLMSRLVPVYLSYDWIWGAELLNHYGLNLKYKVIGDERDSLMCKGDFISKGNLYSLYYYKDIVFIDFKNKKC